MRGHYFSLVKTAKIRRSWVYCVGDAEGKPAPSYIATTMSIGTSFTADV